MNMSINQPPKFNSKTLKHYFEIVFLVGFYSNPTNLTNNLNYIFLQIEFNFT